MDANKLKQVEEILHAALEIPPDERESFFDEFCGEDVELRREVESLLAFEEDSDDFLDTSPESFAAEMFPEREPQTSLINQKIGHYKVKQLLGKGGMGEVFLAEDTRLGRQAALKLLPAQFSSNPELKQRFEQEARAASALNHPNIITIYGIEEAENFNFIATEYIEGQTLRERFDGEPISVGDALDIAVQIASALEAAHLIGIVHLDQGITIAPDNRFVYYSMQKKESNI